MRNTTVESSDLKTGINTRFVRGAGNYDYTENR